MWPDTRLTDLFGIDHPIVQAPMAGSCTPDLAAAVGEAGGLGSLGAGPRPVKVARARVERLRALRARPFNLNFFVHAAARVSQSAAASARSALSAAYAASGAVLPGDLPTETAAGFGDDRLALALDLKPPIVTFHFGLPAPEALRALHADGRIVGATATNVAEARRVAEAGCHFVVAQGFEAGGHRGAFSPTPPDHGVGTLALIPQVADAVDIPVLAAGGIGDGRGVAAALALGASGVQIGTAFLRCPEAATDAARREKLASAQDTDTRVTALVSGRANRVAVGDWAHQTGQPHLPFPLQYSLSAPLQTAGGAAYAAHQYGQAAALAREEPAGAVVARLVDEARTTLRRLQQNL